MADLNISKASATGLTDNKVEKTVSSSNSQPSSTGMFGRDHQTGEVAEWTDLEKRKAAEGHEKFHRLGWKRLTVVLIVEAIALGALSVPSAFASLGMIAGVITCIGIGVVAIYSSYVVGQVKLKFPHVSHYADAGRLLMGKFGYELIGAMFAIELLFLVGSHTLTGAIALGNITENGTCSIVFAVCSAIVLLMLAVPPSFAEVAILGYIDFASIVLAIGITLIGTGISWGNGDVVASETWSAWPKPGLTFVDAMVSLGNIIFAYSFAVCQFSFMDEMHTPKHYVKSIYALGVIEIFIYTITGALIYVFVGQEVQSPALLSAGPTLSKIAFGIALPVIFISGSINTTVVARYIHGRYYAGRVEAHINTKAGWISWLVLITIITFLAWIVAEAIPFFSDLLSIMSCLFISGFTFYFPAWMWFQLIKEGKWYEKKNLLLAATNAFIFVIGIIVLVGGTYASIQDVINQYKAGAVHSAFTCSPL